MRDRAAAGVDQDAYAMADESTNQPPPRDEAHTDEAHTDEAHTDEAPGQEPRPDGAKLPEQLGIRVPRAPAGRYGPERAADGDGSSRPAPPRVGDPSLDLNPMDIRPGRRPGHRYVRIVRPPGASRAFRREAPGYFVATEHAGAPRSRLGRAVARVRRLLLGARLRSAQEGQERVNKLKGLAVFASDNISSSAYATEEVMRVLILAGAAALVLTVPITVAIVIVLAIVVTSYLQVIRAYPNGGGSYVVAHTNLGPIAGLTAGAALLTDYILTVAVSTSAGIAAITSAFPALFAERVLISVVVVTIMTVLNLRGIQESATVFAAPTYIYLAAMAGLLGLGFALSATGGLPHYAAPPEWETAHGAEPLALLLILRAFASGSVALTGTEAVSNGVPAFKPPAVRNAQIILITMGTTFATIFLGMSFLAAQIGILPDPHETETVLSQLARAVVGRDNPYYYLIQFSTAVLLLLAANTAFNGFPRLASILAGDRYLPRQFQFRGDRLAFTAGIIVLAVISALLIVAYEGSVTGLIPLYMVGVFLAFTLSQIGLVRHWWQLRATEPGWRRRATINGIGAGATGVVMIVVIISKFLLGAWMVLVLIPVLIAMMGAIKRHYDFVEDALAVAQAAPQPPPREPAHVVVPVSRLDRATLKAIAVARSLSDDVTAVHLTDSPAQAAALKRRWEHLDQAVPLAIVESPYRALLPPLLAYLDARDQQHPGQPITVVLAEFVPRHFWEYVLHNQNALRLKLRLFLRPNTVVVDVPYHLGRDDERKRLAAASAR
jgi:amino acid transporter